jgi:hypothetical protein
MAYFGVNFAGAIVGQKEESSMRFLIVAVALISALAFASGAFAQTAPQSSQAAPPSGGTGGGLDTEQRGHPNWFTEPNTYKPCPASVVLADGRHICLGCPSACRAHF